VAAPPPHFADLVEMIDRLPLEERESLVEVMRRHNSEDARKRIAASVRSARPGHRRGKSGPESPEGLMRKVLG
jgi:hypothetical protein